MTFWSTAATADAFCCGSPPGQVTYFNRQGLLSASGEHTTICCTAPNKMPAPLHSCFRNFAKASILFPLSFFHSQASSNCSTLASRVTSPHCQPPRVLQPKRAPHPIIKHCWDFFNTSRTSCRTLKIRIGTLFCVRTVS